MRTLPRLARQVLVGLVGCAFLLTSPAVASTYRISSPLGATLQLNGTPEFKGVIVATTTKNNHDTAAPFENTGEAMKGRTIMVQCDAAAYLLSGTVNTATVTTANGVKVEANERVYLMLLPTHGWLAALAVSGTSNCKVWYLL